MRRNLIMPLFGDCSRNTENVLPDIGICWMPSIFSKDEGGKETSLPKCEYEAQIERAHVSDPLIMHVSTTVAVNSAPKSPSSQRDLKDQNRHAPPCEGGSHHANNETRLENQNKTSEGLEPIVASAVLSSTPVGGTGFSLKALSVSDTAISDGNAIVDRGNDRLVEYGASHEGSPRETSAEPKSGAIDSSGLGSQVAAGSLIESSCSFVRLIEEAMAEDDSESGEDSGISPASVSTQPISLHRQAPSKQTWNAKGVEEFSSRGEGSASRTAGKDSVRVGDVGVDALLSHSLSSSESAGIEAIEDDSDPWVTYISPEGYPYVYNPVTGESKWITESEKGSVQTSNPAEVDTASTPVEHSGSRSRQIDRNGGSRYPSPVDVGSHDAVGQEKREAIPETQSNSTWETSDCSKETIDPDTRNSVGQSPLHLAAAQLSIKGLSLLLANGADIDVADGRGRTPLHTACESPYVSKRCSGGGGGGGNVREFIELLLSSGAAGDARDDEGHTPLHLAVLAGNVDAVWALVTAGASEVPDSAGNLPLHLAAAKGHEDIIQILMHNRDKRDNAPRSPSFFSQRDHSQSSVTTETSSDGDETDLLSVEMGNPSTSHDAVADRRIPLDGFENRFTSWKTAPRPRSENSSFGRSSFPGNRGQAESQIGLGYLPSTSDSDEDYEDGSHRLGMNLRKHPSDEVSGTQGQSSGRRRQIHYWEEQTPTWPRRTTPLNYHKGEFEEIMHTADLASEEGGSPVQLQAWSTFSDISTDDTPVLPPWNKAHRGSAAGARDEKGRTPLHYACYTGDVKRTQLLCQMRADPEARDDKGHSPLIVAAATGNTACLQALLEAGADPHGRNELDDTPLHLAAWYSNLDCAKTLVSFGAWLDARNCFGLTPKEALLLAGRKIWKGRVPTRLLDTLEFLENVEASRTMPFDTRDWKSSERSRTKVTTIPTGGHNDRYKREGVISTGESKLRGFEFGRRYFNTRRLLRHSREAAGVDLSEYPVTEERRTRDRKARGGVFHSWKDGVDRRRRAHKLAYSSESHIALDDNAARSLPREAVNAKSCGVDRRHDRSFVDKSPTWQRCHIALNFPSNEKASQKCQSTPREGRRTRSGGEYPLLEATNWEFGARRSTNQTDRALSSGTASSFRAAGGLLNDVRRAFYSKFDGVVHRWLSLFSGSLSGSTDGRNRGVPVFTEKNVQNLLTSQNQSKPLADDELNGIATTSYEVESGGDCLESLVETSARGMEMPLSLTPIQPPQDVLAAMKERMASGKRWEGCLDPPPELAAALREASMGMESSVRRDNVDEESSQATYT